MTMQSGIPLIDAAMVNGTGLAIRDATGEYSYNDLFQASAQLATHLLTEDADLEEARIAFLIPSSFDYVVAQWAIWRAGGIAVPLCTAHPKPELEYVIDNAQVTVVISHPQYEDRLTQILADRPAIKLVDIRSLASLTPPASRNLPYIEPQRRAMIVYTSGTTNRPKGAVSTHANIAAQIRCLVEAWEWAASDSTLHVLPLHHVHGIVNVLCCALWVGAKLEMLAQFDGEKVWQRLIEGGFSLFMAVPTIYVKLAKVYDSASVDEQQQMSQACAEMRLMVSGSAALPVTVMERWHSMTGHYFLERYGMTEIGMALSNPLNGERRPGYVGKPLPGVEVRLVDEHNQVIADEGVTGEIQVKSDNVFLEYWNKPEVTAASFKDGWFCSGDQAVVEKGYYRILGRQSVDLIKSGGYKLFALEIEEVLRKHPAIEECSVVGVPDEEWGEIVCAAVVLNSDADLTLHELAQWSKEELATYKIPRRMVLVADLPRNVMGKVTKPAVKALFQ